MEPLILIVEDEPPQVEMLRYKGRWRVMDMNIRRR